VAAMTLNIFNRHADKVVMANIAQLANVLQALILTEGDRAIATPTYHVYDLYQSHQGAQSVRVECESASVRFAMNDRGMEMPALSASASVRHRDITLSIVNAHASLP